MSRKENPKRVMARKMFTRFERTRLGRPHSIFDSIAYQDRRDVRRARVFTEPKKITVFRDMNRVDLDAMSAQRRKKVNVVLYDRVGDMMLKTRPLKGEGRRHAWFNSNVGSVRKPV